MSLDFSITFEAVFFLFTIGLWISIILDVGKIVIDLKRRRRARRENKHTHDEVLGVGDFLNDDKKDDAEKVEVMKEVLNIISKDEGGD